MNSINTSNRPLDIKYGNFNFEILKFFDILTGSGTLRFGFGTSRSPKYQVQIKLNLVKMVNFPRTITFFQMTDFINIQIFPKFHESLKSGITLK